MEDKKKIPLLKRIWGRKKLLLIIVIVLVVAGFLYQRLVILPKKTAVETAKVERGTVTEELVLSGEISADEYAKLTFPTSGEISWVGVKEGDTVKKGQALTKLNTTVLNTTFQQARATLREEEATVENIHDQVKDHTGDETYVQKDTRTTAEAAKDRAYEAYVAAEYNLRNSTLYSPFAGIASYVAHPFSGVNILFSETQVEVINPQTIYFDVTGDQDEVIDLFIGQQVNILLDSIPDEDLEGTVDFISYTPKAGESGTVYKIKVKFLKGDFDSKKYRIGMTGDAKFVLQEKEGVIYVPPKFVSSDNKGKYLKVGKSSNKVYIEVGIEGEDRVEIKGDIKEGDIVYD